MATTKVLAGWNTQIVGDYDFNTLAVLETKFMDVMNAMAGNSEALFRVNCKASVGLFTTGRTYVVHLYRGGSTTYATAMMQSLGTTNEYIIAGKASTGWAYNRIR